MRIIFLGMNNTGRSILDWMIGQGENVIDVINRKSDLNKILEMRPDLVISGGFRAIVPSEILQIPLLGCINMHKSLLPANRGSNPNFWTIRDNAPAGVTIHTMDAGIDTGKILAQKVVETSFADTGRTLYERLHRAQIDLFTEFWPRFKRGEIEPQQQPAGGSFHLKAEFAEGMKIDPDSTWRALDLLNILRAYTYPPFRNTKIEVDGKEYFVEVSIVPADQVVKPATDDTGFLKSY